MPDHLSPGEVRLMLRHYITERYGTQKQFAERHGVTVSYISHMLNDTTSRYPVPDRFLVLIGVERVTTTIYHQTRKS